MYGRELHGFHHAYYHGVYVLRTEDRLALYRRQIGPEKRPGDDASPLGEGTSPPDESAVVQTCEFDRSRCHAGDEPRTES
jgi:hypothetical protein